MNKKIIMNIVAHTGFPCKIPAFSFQIFIKNVYQFFFVVSEKTTTKFSIYCARSMEKTAELFKTLSKNTSGNFSIAESFVWSWM